MAGKELLDILGMVKSRVQDKLGIVDFPMPQFIVIGSQSVGKSRLVEAFAGETFNFCSGTLGSRRPTVLEFRNVQNAAESKWYYLDKATNRWENRSMAEVQAFVGEAHNSLGHNVSPEPVYVRIESKACCDMQIVDLPGYRSFSMNDSGKELANKIEELNRGFLNDARNVVLCVEEAGDAANCKSLAKVREVDPNYKRTILIRNKLDKYYNDLTRDNVNQWLDGMGDLPKSLVKFAITLPHWGDGQPIPKPFDQIREDMDRKDLAKFTELNCSAMLMDSVGFNNFRSYMEQRTERMFREALGPVLTKIQDLESKMRRRDEELNDEMQNMDPTQMLQTVRHAGMSFAQCLTHVMEGFIRSDVNRMTLEDELRAFKSYHDQLGTSNDFMMLPTPEFFSLDDYIEYLKGAVEDMGCEVPASEVAINGGAQFRRMMIEVEAFLRFSEICTETKKRDVLQAQGIAMNSVGWREVVVKLLNQDAHLPLHSRVKYVGERIKWFFLMQKQPIVQFMKSLKGSPDEKLYSYLYSKHARMIEDNSALRKLVFDTYDNAVQRQLRQFIELFKSTLHATFANPWVFLKKATAKLEDGEDGEEMMLPSFDDSKRRIEQEIQSRAGVERMVTKWIYETPDSPHKIDEAVDRVQLLVLKVYSHIRSQVCDQVELFAESFFKLPLIRKLEEDMSRIELSEVDKAGYSARCDKLKKDIESNSAGLVEVTHCLKALTDFSLKITVKAGEA